MFTEKSSPQRQMEGLRLKHVNLELWQNLEDHDTQGLSSSQLVLRRGRPFKITLLFENRQFNPHTDSLIFKASLGGLYVEFPAVLSKDSFHPEWGAHFQLGDVYPLSVMVHITTSSRSPVGLYSLQLHILSWNQQHDYIIGKFVLLCNPWCQSDAVYIPFEDQREEYVKNDFGLLYMGTPHNVISQPWAFGQYEKGILEICLNILQVSPQHSRDRQRDYLHRSDPVYLSRVVCAMINCEDDRGVLRGNWSGSYRGGLDPSEWTGSADILKSWAETCFSPVEYGQCWVFAAVMCTVMRVLGVPSRVVTNFNSAHDTNGNLIIEEFYTDMGEKLHMSKDSIWNFHVWVECWMTRPDLGSAFSGWQVLDPTPQERSRGIFCCGPCPVKAIRKRRVDLAYDTPFVYAEVNADVLTVIVANGQVVGRSLDTERVGTRIYTKSIGSLKPENLTCAYKCTHDIARLQSTSSQRRKSLDISLSIDKVPVVGEDISVSVTITNKSSVTRSLREHINAQAKDFNNIYLKTFWELRNHVQIVPWEVKTIRHRIPHSQYEGALMADNLVNLAVVIEDERTRERGLASEELNITTPQISIQFAGGDRLVWNKEHSVLVTFTNPFTTPMCNVLLTVEGFGLIEGKAQSKVYLLQAGKTVEKTITFTPTSAGTKMLQASLVSKNSSAIIRSFHTVSVTTE
ncbi:protein-glutamine gamma-glutamyltransferase 5-like [Megalops cyprinoides]|uniref:protein-glutamine gamma-glutamyltransferase 5-like n=1 Tax=Megalops cyprinoides TaxID=118141 RepID=UPI001863A135|nr:protein-glutamine gamma-glutamyltransferase 5-like [Megalops cyprinoides]